MSFSGNLEHLPVVDVMQLLETTKKSGTLIVNNINVTYKFGFENGYIVSVQHPDDPFSLTKVLVIKGFLDEESARQIYEESLKNKLLLGEDLVANKKFTPQSLLKLLTSFIELTVVDILTWNKGTFQLVVENIEISEEFKYLATVLQQKFFLSTQNVLMEALRIYDEWNRDNLLKGGVFSHKLPDNLSETAELEITEDLLGLNNIDQLDRRIPNVFMPIKESDYINPHKKVVLQAFNNFSEQEQEELINFLSTLDTQKSAETQSNIAIIYYGSDAFTNHAITTICESLNLFAFTTDSEENIETIVNQSVSKTLTPVIIVDGNDTKLKNSYPAAKVIRVAELDDYETILKFYEEGCYALFPKPDRTIFNQVFSFFKTLHTYLTSLNSSSKCLQKVVTKSVERMKISEKVSEVAAIFAEFLSGYFKRNLIIVMQKDHPTVEKVTGFSLTGIVNINDSRIINDVINNFKIFFGNYDEELKNIFYKTNECPLNKLVCLVPLSGLNKTLYLIYADELYNDVCLQQISLLNEFANTTINAILYRKLFEKNKKTI